VRDRQGAREIGQEDGARLERRDEQRFASRIRVGELGAELDDPLPDLRTGQIDVPDGVSIRRQSGR
jgi:hypothetical protein